MFLLISYQPIASRDTMKRLLLESWPSPSLSLSLSCELALSFSDGLLLFFAAQLAFGHKPSFLAHGAHDTSLAHVLAEALEQALLRFTSP